MLEQLIEFDKSFLIFLNNLGSQSWDGFWMVVTNKRTFIPMYLVLLYFMCKPLSKKDVFLLLISITFMIIFTDQITNLFKFTFETSSSLRTGRGVGAYTTRGVLGDTDSFRAIPRIQWQQLFSSG